MLAYKVGKASDDIRGDFVAVGELQVRVSGGERLVIF